MPSDRVLDAGWYSCTSCRKASILHGDALDDLQASAFDEAREKRKQLFRAPLGLKTRISLCRQILGWITLDKRQLISESSIQSSQLLLQSPEPSTPLPVLCFTICWLKNTRFREQPGHVSPG